MFLILKKKASVVESLKGAFYSNGVAPSRAAAARELLRRGLAVADAEAAREPRFGQDRGGSDG
jgi:hypothetical protein